jgi:hypothetical protein
VISAGGGLSAGTITWTRSTAWPVYQESAELVADQEAGTGPALELGLGYRLFSRVGVRAAYALLRRDTSATVRADIPHPFFFETPRGLEATLEGLEYEERAAHLDLEVWPVTGRFELGLFGGVAFVSVEADLVDRVEYDEEYPYDAVTFRAATTSRSGSESAVGWSAGAVAVFTLAPRWGLAVQARYTKAKVDLSTAGGAASPVDAGGWRALGLLRFGF